MRPEPLYPLFASVESLKGVGKKITQKLVQLTGATVWDVLCHFPRTLLNRTLLANISQAFEHQAQHIIVKAIAIQHLAPPRRNMPYRVIMMDVDGDISTRLELIFFNINRDYLTRSLPLNQPIMLVGKIDFYQQKLQMVHPQIMPIDSNINSLKNEPVYRLSAGISRLIFRKIMVDALDKIPTLPEWWQADLLAQHQLPPLKEALHQIHAPNNEADLLPDHPARIRLAFDELLANQLMLNVLRMFHPQQNHRRTPIDNNIALCNELIANLPFQLTASQQRTFAEITESLQQNQRMLRLLQGDVGSGKTIIALLAMLLAIGEAGQAALLAPTDILVKQHYHTISNLLKDYKIDVIMLTGKMPAKQKKQTLEQIEHHGVMARPQIIIGTHALFQEQVRYHDLRLAVIDEQHRFGVHQRVIFSEKAQALDMIVMSATPIPRTLMLSHWHNLQVSRLTELPKGRKPILTRLFSDNRMVEIISAISRALEQGRKIYWVCPLIEQDENEDAEAEATNPAKRKTDVTYRAQELRKHFKPEQIEILHGKMSASDKEQALANFTQGKAQILVATTVIEVGMDVPDASIMVIEHAEQFGLAALHQLRGRVGRGETDSFCLLIHSAQISPQGEQRLLAIRNHHDGFEIAELDLQLRGSGDVLGVRQSGLPDFRFVEWQAHQHYIEQVQQIAQQMLANITDTQMRAQINYLLYLFEHDNAVRLLSSA